MLVDLFFPAQFNPGSSKWIPCLQLLHQIIVWYHCKRS